MSGYGGIVGGALGAVAGSFIPVVGWKLGWSIGATIGGFLDQQNANTGGMSDRKVSGSQYGTSYPRIWGRVSVAGAYVWFAKDADGNHLIEHSRGGGGVGGSGGSSASGSAKYYTLTFCALFDQATYLLPDPTDIYGGTLRYRSATLKRVKFDDKIVYDDGTSGSPLTLGGNLSTLAGTETQLVNSVIEAVEGVGNWNAYRGMRGIVVQDFNLENFGNHPPNVTAEWETGSVTLGDILLDLTMMAGVSSSRIDVSRVTTPITGYVMQGGDDPKTHIDGLCTAYLVDLANIDGILTFIPRGGAPVVTFSTDDLAATDGSSFGPRVTFTRKHKTEIPHRVEVTYYDVDKNFEQGMQPVTRLSGNRSSVVSFSMPVVCTADEAKQIGERILDTLHTEIGSYRFVVPYTFLALVPTDVVNLPTADGVKRVRLAKATLDPIKTITFEAVPDNSAVVTQSGTGAGGGSGITPSEVIPTTFIAWSGKEIRDEDQSSPGFYVAVTADSGWTGCTIYYSLDGGTTWLPSVSVSTRATFGVTTGVLSASGAVANTFDNTNTVGVDVTTSKGSLASVSDDTLLTGVNHAVVGNEILGVGTVTLTSAYHYTLSHLRRGERGSTMSGHASGERFVLLENGIARVSVPQSFVGATVKVKAVTAGQDIADVTAVDVVIAARTPTALEVVQSSALTYEAIPPTNVASYAGGSRTAVSWTTFDASGILPAGTTFAVVQGIAQDEGSPLGTPGPQSIEVRKNSGGDVYTLVTGTIGIADSDLHLCSTMMVPVTSDRKLDYRVVAGFGDGWSLKIVGAWKPVGS